MASPEATVVTVGLSGGGEPVRLRFEPSEDPAAPGTESPWSLEAEPDWDRLEGIRMASARFEDGRALGVAALRPRGANGHDDDVVIARLLDAEGQANVIEEALVSVEFDAGGAPRRLGMELWPESGGAPLRVAADRDESLPAPTGRGDAVGMAFRLDGTGGTGLYEILRRN